MTKLKLLLAIFSCLLVVEAHALKVQGDILSEASINSRPSYFFKASSDGSIIAYNYNYDGRSDTEGVNKLYFLETKETINIPGPWDPVFIHDSDLMVIPYVDSGGVFYNFYKVSELKKKWRTAEPIFKDRGLNGYYQSVGILERSVSFIDFRVIAEGKSNSHLMRDYRYDLRTKKMSPLRGVKRFCSRFSLKLPMMSKNGKELAGINQRTSTTNIFSIDNNGRCEVVADLGKKTGKVNFSYDGSRITYHIYSTKNTTITDNFVRTPSDDYTADVYIYDRTTQEERRLTYNKKDNSLYPEFLKDGNMIFINYPHRSNEKVKFYTIRAKKPQNHTLEFSKFSDWIHPDKLDGGDTLSYSVNAPLPISSVTLAARNSEVEVSSVKLLLKSGRFE